LYGNITFVILAFVSPVTYSIASLFKRIAIICIALVWFNAHVHPIRGVGIALTLLGIRIIGTSPVVRHTGVVSRHYGKAHCRCRVQRSALDMVSLAHTLHAPAYEPEAMTV